MIVSPLNSRGCAAKSPRTFRMASSPGRSVSASRTPRWYVVTTTTCTWSAETRCPPRRSSVIVRGWWHAGVVQVRYRYRLYPSPGQQRALARVFGCARVVYNDCLRLRDACHAGGEKISDTEVQRRVITLAKLTPERSWLGEVASVALVQACQDARRAYRSWFDSLSGRRKGRRLARTRLARSVQDAGWSQLLRLVEEKAARYGRTFARIGRFEPTSQVCSACGVKDGPKPLSIRIGACAACGTVHDRDVNAARNILAAGRADNENACEAGVRPRPVAAGAEAGTHRSAA